MTLTEKQISFINENEWVIFATCASGAPRAGVVMPSRVEADQIILADVQMGTSAKNVRANPQVFISSYNKDMSRWMKITGTAKYLESGELFKEIHDFELTRDVKTRAIIVVSIDSVSEGAE